MNSIRLIPVALAAALLAACGGQATQPSPHTVALVAPPDGALVASVNGETVTEPLLLTFARGRGLDPAIPEQREQALELLIDTVLLAQDGIGRGLTERPEVQSELSLVWVQQLSGRAMADFRGSLDIGDEQVQRYYQQEVDRAGDTEWLVEHILFDDRARAERVVAQAREADADFDALMGMHQHAALQARQLGWSNATQVPAEIATALRQLADGEVAPVPIETSFGWHVLRRADSRPFNPPPLEQVREGARRQLIERATVEHVEALRTRATIAKGAGGS